MRLPDPLPAVLLTADEGAHALRWISLVVAVAAVSLLLIVWPIRGGVSAINKSDQARVLAESGEGDW